MLLAITMLSTALPRKAVADSLALGCGEKARQQIGMFRCDERYWFATTPAPSRHRLDCSQVSALIHMAKSAGPA